MCNMHLLPGIIVLWFLHSDGSGESDYGYFNIIAIGIAP